MIVKPVFSPNLSETFRVVLALLEANVRVATVGLGVSDIAYRMTRFGVVSVHGFGARAWLWSETVYRKECIYTAFCTAMALQSIPLFQSLLHCIAVFFCPPTPACIYIYFTLDRYRIDMGAFLALWQWV